MNKYLAQYKQQMSRLRRIQREAEKRDYIFPISPLPRAVKNPTEKTIQRLSAITPTKLRSKGYKPTETGELVRQTARRQEAERKAQALAREQEHIRTALERYAKQREERRLAQWTKQHEAEINRITTDEIQEYESQKREYTTSEKLLRSNHPQEILDIYNVSDPADLPMKALERYAMLYDYDSKYEPENANVPEPPITYQEFKKISERKEEEERERKRKEEFEPIEWPQVKSEPMPYKDLVRLDIENLINEIDYGRNPQVSDFLKRAIEDEITSLEMEYGEGKGAEIFAERLASTNEDLLNAARTTALSYDGGELQASSMKLLTVIRGTPSNEEKAELEKLVFEATDGVEISRKKRGYFRR